MIILLDCLVVITRLVCKNEPAPGVSFAFFRFFSLFNKYNGHKNGKLKLKRPRQLQEILDIARWLLAEPGAVIQEKRHKVEQLKDVLEM